jgi:hypothetical protein
VAGANANVDTDHISELFEGYFERKGLPLDRKIDILTPGTPDVIAAHNIHPHNSERSLYTPHIDMFWKYAPEVALSPSDPTKFGEEGTNIIAWGKTHMNISSSLISNLLAPMKSGR